MTYYEVLEIDGRASTEDVERAYRRLARKVHPDLAPGDRAKAEARMKLLNEIRDTLTDPLLRAGYDERLRLEAMRTERAAPPRTAPSTSAPEPPRAVVVDRPAPRPPWVATAGLVALGFGGVAGAFLFYPRLASHLPEPFEETRAPADPDAAPLLTTPVLGAAREAEPRLMRPRARGRGAVHLGSSADDVLRVLGPPDAVEPGRHPGESVMRYGSLRLEMRNGRVAGGDAAAR